jgi:hypothetical protein
MSRTTKKACLHILVVFFLFCASIATSFVPGFDLAKSAVLALVVSFLYVSQAAARGREEECDRYRRVCGEVYPVRLGEDPAHLSNILLSGDIPHRWVKKLGELLNMDVKVAAGKFYHSLDAFCHFGDLPGDGLIRATHFVSTVVAQGRNLEEALRELVGQNQQALGKEFQKGCYICELQLGQMLPYGIFLGTGSTRLLVAFYTVRRAVKGLDIFGREVIRIKEVSSMRICVRASLEPAETKKIVNELFNKETHPDNFGSGPQDRGLFIQETVSVDRASVEKRLPELIKALKLE